MIKRYRTKVIGDGSSMDNSRRPEFYDEAVKWTIVDDLGDQLIVEVTGDEATHDIVKAYPFTELD